MFVEGIEVKEKETSKQDILDYGFRIKGLEGWIGKHQSVLRCVSFLPRAESPNLCMDSINSACDEAVFKCSISSSTRRNFFKSICTSIMSAKIRSRATAESKFRAART